jgi:peptide/nickel transport system substrate-binding protein
MQFRIRAFTLAVVSAVLVVALGSCVSSAPPQGASAEGGGTATFRLNGDWTVLDPQRPAVSPGVNAGQIQMATYDRLVAVGPDNTLVPYLATSWDVTPTSLRFTLRADAKCEDGTPVTPTVVADSFKRLLDPSINSYARVTGFGDGPFSVSSDDAAGTLTITLGTPFSDAIYWLAHPTTGIVCPAGLAALSTDPHALETKTYGSGPYSIVSATHGDNVTLKLRPEWNWGPSDPSGPRAGLPDTLVFKVVSNETTAANLVVTGGLDVAPIIGPDVQRLLGSSELIDLPAFGGTVNPLLLNHAPAHPTADEAVRQAIMTAIDPQAWNQAQYAGLGQVGTSILAPTTECFDAETAKLLPTPSIEAAKAILTSVGYSTDPDGTLAKDGKPLALKLIGYSGQNSGPEYLRSQLAAVGFSVDFAVTDQATWLQEWRAGNWDVTVGGFVGGANAGSGFRSLAGPFPTDPMDMVDPVIEQAYASAVASVGPDKCQYWSVIQRQMISAHHYLPLAAQRTDWFTRGFDLWPATSYVEPVSIRRKP